MSLVPLEDVKAWLKITSTDSDQVLQSTLNSAESYMARRVGAGSVLAAEAITQRVDGLGQALVLTTLPVISVTSVTDSGGSTLAVANLDVDKERGIIRYAPNAYITFPMNWYTVVYQAGFATLDFDYAHAVKEVTRQFWGLAKGNRLATDGGPDQTVAMANANAIIDSLPKYGFA